MALRIKRYKNTVIAQVLNRKAVRNNCNLKYEVPDNILIVV